MSTGFDPHTFAVVEALLTDSFGTRVTIERIEPLDRPWVMRAHLTDESGLPDTVIVKCARTRGYGLRSAGELMRCEHAALAFIPRTSTKMSRRVYLVHHRTPGCSSWKTSFHALN